MLFPWDVRVLGFRLGALRAIHFNAYSATVGPLSRRRFEFLYGMHRYYSKANAYPIPPTSVDRTDRSVKHVFTSIVTEVLTERLIATVEPPPQRYERWSEYGLRWKTAVDVYNTQVRELGLWVADTGCKYFGVTPRRLPAGVSPMNRKQIAEDGIMIGSPSWVSKDKLVVLTVDRARIEAMKLLAVIPKLVPWEGQLDGDGVLELGYSPPRLARGPRRKACVLCGH